MHIVDLIYQSIKRGAFRTHALISRTKSRHELAATTPEYIYKVTIRVMFMDIIVWKIQKRYAADVKDNTIDRSRTLRLRRLLARARKNARTVLTVSMR